jgi:LacI family transcriptional regulator
VTKKRVTLQDVAREAGVSSMTVSRVVNDTGKISQATREHVRAVIARLGYRPSRSARALVTNRTYLLGVTVPDITNPYFSTMVHGIEDVASENGYSVLLVNFNETPAREHAALNQIDDSTIDGLIACSSRLPDDVLFPLLEHHRAVVSVNRPLPDHLGSCVLARYRYGYRSYLAAHYLSERGYERIGYVPLKRSFVAMQIDELITRLANDGITVKEEWTASCLPTWEAGYAAGRDLLARHPQLDAIIGGNDLVALGVMRAAVELGHRVPDDLAIIGGDDVLLASQVNPPLTTFHVPTYEIGDMAARLLFRRLGGDEQYREHIYDETLVERSSVLKRL